MRKFLSLLDREVKSYFYSPIAWVVMFFFLLLTGFAFYAAVQFMALGPTPVTLVEAFFNQVPFWFGFILIIPLITMRSFSEEWKMGTIEPLMTAPVRDWQVVLAKFGGALFFYAMLWMPSLLYFRFFEIITGVPAVRSNGAYGGAYLLLLLLGMFYISVGCLASALTRNQIIAGVISLCGIMLLFFFAWLSFFVFNASPLLTDFINYFSALDHMGTFSKGIIDSRPVVYYLSMTALMLFLTHRVFQTRKWKM